MLRRLFIIITAIYLAGCGDESTGPAVESCDLPCQLDKSPYPDEEAEAAALYLNGGVVAQEEIYSECLNALSSWRNRFKEFDSSRWFYPREEFSDTGWINPTELRFYHPLDIGHLVLYFYMDPHGRAVLNGAYHYWDSLNLYYRVGSVRTSTLFDSTYVSAELNFHGRLSGKKLAEYYRDLPGIWLIDYHIQMLMDGSNLYIGRDNAGKISFVADFGWGDCMAGCMSHKSYYFKQQWNSNKRTYDFAFIGSYLTNDPEPAWWPEARRIKSDWQEF